MYMNSRQMVLLVLLLFYGCSKEEDKLTQKNGFVKLSAQVDARVRFKAALVVDNYDVNITSKADAKFSYGKIGRAHV